MVYNGQSGTTVPDIESTSECDRPATATPSPPVSSRQHWSVAGNQCRTVSSSNGALWHTSPSGTDPRFGYLLSIASSFCIIWTNVASGTSARDLRYLLSTFGPTARTPCQHCAGEPPECVGQPGCADVTCTDCHKCFDVWPNWWKFPLCSWYR